MNTQPAAEIKQRRGCIVWLAGMLVAFCLISGVTAVIIYQWQQKVTASGISVWDANPQLALLERFYLQNYLANYSDTLLKPTGSGSELQQFTIEAGETAVTITPRLESAGLLSDGELFLNYLRYYGLDNRLQTGQFTLDPQWNIVELASAISSGSALDVQISFLPGMRIEEMADYLARIAPGNIDASDFLGIAKQNIEFDTTPYPFLASLPPNATLEGYLLPGSYNVPPTANANYLVHQMLQSFDRQVTPTMRQAFGVQGLSLHEAISLASIVAREALVEEERPLIANVYLNRLNVDMPLQADPTVQYALGYQASSQNWWKVPLTLDDLAVDDAYNTYLVFDLPPGPISNPGLTSLQAVAEPEQTDYFFFVADCVANTGEHIFSKTFEEHLVYAQRCQ